MKALFRWVGDHQDAVLGTLFLIAVTVCFSVCAYASVQERREWTRQCVQSGNSEWECDERWDRAHPPPAVVPVFIPTPAGRR